MYPFRTEETFVRNAWYVGCSVDELADGPLERTILGRPVVFYRSEGGEVFAMHALCPHRAYPLALRGEVHGDAIQCAYHGFRYDGRSGACVRVPTQDTPPASFRQRIYPVSAQGPWVWIWPGDPALADKAHIPGLEEIGFGKGWTYLDLINFIGVKARYMFLIENLFDLTHLAFLHGDKLDCEALIRAPVNITETDRRISVVRPMQMTWSDLHDIFFGPTNRFEGSSEAASETVYYGPGYITTTTMTLYKIDGQERVDKTIHGDVYFHHAITPETAHSCHYFGTSSRTHRLDDVEFDRSFRPFEAAVRQQDIEAVEAMEAHMIQFGEPTVELMVKTDTAAGRLRRHIQRTIEAEQAAVSVTV